jgi:glycosyltransferase involved in cell wall biosynthesis
VVSSGTDNRNAYIDQPIQIVVEEKKVLIITYYWPPSGGSGVQRWLKFVKYLPQMGWQPYVFTPENPSFQVQDPSLFKDVPDEVETIHFPIWEPYDLFNKISGFAGSKNQAGGVMLPGVSNESFFKKLSTWIRGNFFIPDPRKFWVRPSVKFLSEFLEDNDIKVIVTTGPPHSMHLIGYHLKKNNKSLKWIADFRDPWSEWGFLDSLRISKFARGLHKKLERRVLTTADIVTTITPFYVKHFERLGGRKVDLVSNGFDDEDFQSLRIQKTEKFLIRHVGIVNEKCDPRPFFKAFENLLSADKEFSKHAEVEFIGQVYGEVILFVNRSEMLRDHVKFTNRVPHKELIALYGASSVLLLVLTGYKDAEGYMPGKLYEYVATGLPVLGVGPETGDAAALLNETGNGEMIDGEKTTHIEDFLLNEFKRWQQGTSVIKKGAARNYSRSELTRSLTKLFS